MPPKLTTSMRNAAAILRLEEQLRACQQQLSEETERHVRASAEVALLQALALASHALHALLHADPPPGGAAAAGPPAAAAPPACAEAAGDVERVLQSLEDHLAALRLQVWPSLLAQGRSCAAAAAGAPDPSAGASNEAAAERPPAAPAPPTGSAAGGDSSCGDGGGNGGGGGGAADGGSVVELKEEQDMQPQQGAESVPPACGAPIDPHMVVPARTFFASMLEARGLSLGPESFLAFWRQRVTRLGVLLHQRQRRPSAAGTPSYEEINLLWLSLATCFGGLCFSNRSWAVEMLTLNMETGARAEAPQHVWDEVWDVLDPSPEQGLMLLLLHRWWQDTMQALARQRHEMAQKALEAPQDVELQEQALAGLERAQAAYVCHAFAANVVALSALLTPDQCAELYVQSHPHIPIMTALLDRWHARVMAGTASTTAAGAVGAPAPAPATDPADAAAAGAAAGEPPAAAALAKGKARARRGPRGGVKEEALQA